MRGGQQLDSIWYVEHDRKIQRGRFASFSVQNNIFVRISHFLGQICIKSPSHYFYYKFTIFKNQGDS